MKEAPADREQLIYELESVAAWDEEMKICSEAITKYKAPQDNKLPEYAEFKEENTKTTDLGKFILCVFFFAYLGGFYHIYFHTDFFPNGFFKGILIFIVSLVVGFVLMVLIGMKFEQPLTEEEKEKRLKEYQEKKEQFDRENLARKSENDKNYNAYSKRIATLQMNQPDTFIPDQYRNNPQYLRCLAEYIKSYRADSFAEAVNLHATIQHQQRLENSARRQEELARKAAQEAEMARLSADSAYYASKYNKK